MHFRDLLVPADAVGRLIDGLAGEHDLLWPHEVWPRMDFDRPLGIGADGGHGPVRYEVVGYEAGSSVIFRFKAPRGFEGTHRFDVDASPHGSRLTHTLRMTARWPATLTWPLVFRPLHDALLEDCMAKAQIALGEHPTVLPWTAPVRLLRRALGRGRVRPQSALTAQPSRAPGR